MNKHKRLGAEINHNSLPYSVKAVQRISTDYTVNIIDTIETMSDVEDVLFALGIAEEQDTVTINLNCNGGNVYVGDSIIHAMNNCKAPVRVIASGVVASFATFILLEASQFEISPFCEILCHSASFGSYGKMHDTKEHVDFSYKQCKRLLEHYYRHFLTEDEIEDMVVNKREIWMDADEFVTRYEKRNQAYLEEQSEENNEEFTED
jgi:ATP-dependent protease ClpP protease subunit